MLTRRVTFRLYPSKTQTAKLFEWRKLHQLLYNSAVADRKDSYQRLGQSVDYFDQQNALPAFKEVWPEYKELGSHALQATLKRVDFAFVRFFKGLGKYPKFKSIRHFSGWTYPDRAGWKAGTDGKNGYLRLSNLGHIQMRGQARTWGIPTTCTILFRNEKWLASITVNCQPVRETSSGAIGLDFGCETAIATSDGQLIENPRYLGKTLTKVRQASKGKRRKTALNWKRKIKASNRWRRAQKRVSKLTRKVSLQRQDWSHKVAAQIVSCNSLVATEKLNLRNMTRKANRKGRRQKAGLNRSILDVGMGYLRSCIEYKLVEANGVFIEVPTQQVKPSQTCPGCGHQKKKTLEQRMHICSCGCTANRDVAAAQVMLKWALGTSVFKRGETSSISCGSLRQLGSKKRQKLRAS